MRRSDREIKEAAELERILEECKIFRIALQDDQGPYIVPLNFGFEFIDGALTLYFHSASKGRKISALQMDSRVAFEMDCGHELVEGKVACEYSWYYKSIIGEGRAELITEANDKKKALSVIMRHQTGKDFSFQDRMIGGVNVYRLTVESFTGKAHV